MAVGITKIYVIHSSARTPGSLKEKLLPQSGTAPATARALAQFFMAAAGGVEPCSIQVGMETTTSSAGDKASATCTITHANVTANDTLTIGGRVLTWKAAAANENEVTIGSDATTDATALKNAINAHSELKQVVSATSAAGVVTVACLYPGLIGKHLLWSTSDATAMALSTAALNLGTSPTSLAVPATFERGF